MPPGSGDDRDLPFACEVVTENETASVRPTGELDLASVPTLDAHLRRTADMRPRGLVVDLLGLSFIDSSGLHLLLKWANTAAGAGIAFSVLPGNPAVQRVFSLAGVEHLLPFAPSDVDGPSH